jgi:hypothetical protein
MSARVTDYQARKESGRCVYPKCIDFALDDSIWCKAHRDRQRQAKREYRARSREMLTAARKCVECRRPSETHRCIGCRRRRGDIETPPTRGVDKKVDNTRDLHHDTHAERIEIDGYHRKRFRGTLGRRGNPGKAVSDKTDLDFGAASLQEGRDRLLAVAAIVDKRERMAAEMVALGQLDLVLRFVGGVLERHRYQQRIR